jgi:hypothetical protein
MNGVPVHCLHYVCENTCVNSPLRGFFVGMSCFKLDADVIEKKADYFPLAMMVNVMAFFARHMFSKTDGVKSFRLSFWLMLMAVDHCHRI